ncbi:hypothetical protein LTR37_016536, partial [Vermiconidia calcicola]
MALSSRSTSPDPLTQESSPLAARTRNAARRKNKPLAARSGNVASPSKSFVLDTGEGSEKGPLRIKVTVEAQPNAGSSPSKKITRTTKVPLKGGNSSSPVKQSLAKKELGAEGRGEIHINRPQRKRKGTPIRRVAKRSPSTDGEADFGRQVTMSQQLQENLPSPFKQPSVGRSRVERPAARTERTRRLTRAREELDDALQDAIGRDIDGEEEEDEEEDDEAVGPTHDYAVGDMTVANEDFTMVSVETLESMKQNTSLLDTSGIDKSVASVSFMPSSPPQMQAAGKGEGVEEVRYQDITLEAQERKPKSSDKKPVEYDAMSWKPTGPSVKTAMHQISPQQRLDSEPTEWRLRRQAVSKEIENASASQVVVIDDDTQAGANQDSGSDAEAGGVDGDELDIWAEEASRSIEEDHFVHEQEQGHLEKPVTYPENLNDVFSDQQQKPPRPKIPRTWRRTSGMDFSYVDSPEHGALQSRKVSASTDGEGAGSRSDGGVLTPPESSEDEDSRMGAQEGESSLFQPDAAATLLEAQQHEPAAKQTTSPLPRNQVVSPDSDSSSRATSPEEEGDDTGMFWQTHLPNLYQRRQRPRIQKRQKAMELSELLGLDKSSPKKTTSSTGKQVVSAASERQYGSQRRAQSRITTNSRAPGRVNAVTKEKVVSSPLRKSLLKSSKIGGYVLPGSSSQHISSSPLRSSRASEPSVGEDVSEITQMEHSKTESSFAESFESKASDQRQLLAEMG